MKAKCQKILTDLGWLAAQPEAFRDRWLEACEYRRLRAGEHLYSLGDPPGGIYGLAEGFIDVLLTATPFPPSLAYIARPGWWVGEGAAVTDTPRRVEVRARTDLGILYLDPQRLKQLTETDPQVWRALGQLTVTHLDNALMLASSLVKGDARVKILTTLVRLAGAVRSRDAVISIPCSQQELGEMVGLSRNSVGPVLRKLEGEGLISREVYGEVAYNPVRLDAALSR